jgi:hypothetical protein
MMRHKEPFLSSKYFKFDPDVSFFGLKAFRWSFWGGVGLSAICAVVIIWNSNLTWAFDYEGFDYAITVFRVPLGILATLIPVIALLAANHRSVQTQEQIRVTSANNNFSNFFRHKEEFKKFLGDNDDLKKLVLDWLKLHKFLFPNARGGELAVGLNVNKRLLEFKSELDVHFKVLVEAPLSEFLLAVKAIDDLGKEFFDDIGMRLHQSTNNSVPITITKDQSLAVPDGCLEHVFRAIGDTLDKLVSISSFDDDFRVAPEIETLIRQCSTAPRLKPTKLDSSSASKITRYRLTKD